MKAIPGTRLLYVENDPGVTDISDPLSGLYLVEGKAIGTASMKANVGERDLGMRGHHRTDIQAAIQAGSRNAPRALTIIYNEHRRELGRIVNEYIAGTLRRKDARLDAAKQMRTAYERVRVVARRASGVEALATESTIFREEEKWFRSAVNEEVGYFHAFIQDIQYRRAGNIHTRVEAYVKALRFMYEAARVQAMPDNVLLYWTGPRKADDPKVCEGCEYMMERSPFPKDILPAVPRDGMTPCLTNCRHHILVRVVEDLNEVVQRRHVLGKRVTLLRALKERKAAAGLGRAMPKVTGSAKNPFKGTPLTQARAPRRQRR